MITSVGGQAGRGGWTWTGGRGYGLTIAASGLDGEGRETARSTATAVLTVAADGASFEGPYVNVVTDGAGRATGDW